MESSNRSNGNLQKLEKQIVEANPQIFAKMPAEKRHKIVRELTLQVKQTIHSGPIPDAETLRQYNDIIPDGANRIMIMAEKQAEHRMSLEKKVVGSQSTQSLIGQIFALIIGIFALSVSGYCISQGYEFGGGVLGVGGVGGLVYAFINGKEKQRKDLDSKK